MNLNAIYKKIYQRSWERTDYFFKVKGQSLRLQISTVRKNLWARYFKNRCLDLDPIFSKDAEGLRQGLIDFDLDHILKNGAQALVQEQVNFWVGYFSILIFFFYKFADYHRYNWILWIFLSTGVKQQNTCGLQNVCSEKINYFLCML